MSVALLPASPTTEEAEAGFSLNSSAQDWLLDILEELGCDLSLWAGPEAQSDIPAVTAVQWANALRLGMQENAEPVREFLKEHPGELDWLRSFERFLGYCGGFTFTS